MDFKYSKKKELRVTEPECEMIFRCDERRGKIALIRKKGRFYSVTFIISFIIPAPPELLLYARNETVYIPGWV